ncbi:MAG: hypothetical protein J6V76_01410 [Bacteroidales bacterium]|nr:hypothetical protein [Bacteroidales bacterium]
MYKIVQYSYICPQKLKAGTGGSSYHFTTGELAETNFLTALYRKIGIDYPKFFKMDTLAKSGFLASELLIEKYPIADNDKQSTAVICFNRLSTIDTDIKFAHTIADPDNCYPSPSLFVYTLPNIVTGEIAIRQGFTGETAFYSSEKFMPQQIEGIVNDVLAFSKNVLVAWIDIVDSQPLALMFMVADQDGDSNPEFNADNMQSIYSQLFNPE